MRSLVTNFIFAVSAASVAAIHGPSIGGPIHQPNLSSLWAPISVGLRQASLRLGATTTSATPSSSATDLFSKVDTNIDQMRGGSTAETCSGKPCAKFLQAAYTACGLATTAAWSTVVYTSIRSNQPKGAMMPSWQHGFFARIGAMSAVPIIAASYATLASSASKSTDSWDELASPTCRRHNLALATAGLGSALWTRFAETITKIPGTELSHQSYQGAMRWGLISCYGSGAVLGAAVWARSLPDDVRRNPFSWPGRIADGVSRSLVSLAPANLDDPVNVKYSILTSTFLVFTGLMTLCSHPITCIPSWTGRRLPRAFPAWTILAAATSFDLKEASESGRLLIDSNYRRLSSGIRSFGVLYLGAKAGAVFLDPSFPEAFHAVAQVPGLAVMAITLVGLTLRSDEQ